MPRLAPAVLAALALVTTATAQPADVPAVKLTVSPAATPTPALKYELLPRLRDKTPGNAAEMYTRAFLLAAQNTKPDEKPDIETPQRWLSAPRDKFPVEEARKLVARNAELLRDVERAALAERCDWHLLARFRADGIAAMLPEFHPARETAHLLALRSRLELIDGHVDESIRTLRVVFQIARHLSDGPSHFNTLFACGVGSNAVDRVEELIQQPNAPNLYWALCGLPRPFTDPAAGLEGDDLMFRAMFPSIKRLEGGALSQTQADEAVSQFFADLGKGGKTTNPVDGLIAGFGMAVLINRQQAAARKELIARGRPAKEVEAMPANQAVFLASWERYKSLRDDAIKWFRQPYPVALAKLERTHEQFKQAKERAVADKDVFGLPFIVMTPAFNMTFSAHVRLERRLAALRAVEALRLHAAAHGGKWPAALGEVTAVAVPDDPATGRPFAYAVNGDTATLSGPPPRGRAPNRGDAVRYELTPRRVK